MVSDVADTVEDKLCCKPKALRERASWKRALPHFKRRPANALVVAYPTSAKTTRRPFVARAIASAPAKAISEAQNCDTVEVMLKILLHLLR